MMKLTPELKKRIDDWFDNISPDELYNLLKNEYGFRRQIQDRFIKMKEKEK